METTEGPLRLPALEFIPTLSKDFSPYSLALQSKKKKKKVTEAKVKGAGEAAQLHNNKGLVWVPAM